MSKRKRVVKRRRDEPMRLCGGGRAPYADEDRCSDCPFHHPELLSIVASKSIDPVSAQARNDNTPSSFEVDRRVAMTSIFLVRFPLFLETVS
jgi:hypothetical protein